MEPVPILYVVDSLLAGGIESQLVALVTGLDRARFAPHVLCLYGPRAGRDLRYLPELKQAGIPVDVLDLGWGARDKARAVSAIAAAARRLRPALLQAEGYHANLLARLAWPALPRRTRLIGSVRGSYTAKQLLYERLGTWLCARVVVNGPQLKDMLVAQAGLRPSHISYIPNGIASERFAQPRDPEARARLAPGARWVLLSLGRISFEKNHHWLVEALGVLRRAGRLPSDGGVRLLLAGAPHHARAQALLDTAIARDGLADVVTQLPATPHPEDLYAAADLVVLYSPSEGMPSVALEALAAGRPVLISAGANAAGVVRDEVTGWVVPGGDPAALAARLGTILAGDPARLKAMRPACLAAARAFSVERMVAAYGALYDELLGRRISAC